jgi:hypothetical protein
MHTFRTIVAGTRERLLAPLVTLDNLAARHMPGRLTPRLVRYRGGIEIGLSGDDDRGQMNVQIFVGRRPATGEVGVVLDPAEADQHGPMVRTSWRVARAIGWLWSPSIAWVRAALTLIVLSITTETAGIEPPVPAWVGVVLVVVLNGPAAFRLSSWLAAILVAGAAWAAVFLTGGPLAGWAASIGVIGVLLAVRRRLDERTAARTFEQGEL